MDPFDFRSAHNLRQILESQEIVKVWHDYCDSCSILLNHYELTCKRVIDTQIAHRAITQAKGDSGDDASNDQISLNSLILKYLRIDASDAEREAFTRSMGSGWCTVRPLDARML